MSLLIVVQDVCDLVGVPRAGSIVGSSEPDAQQFLQLATREAQALSRRTGWQVLMTERTFLSVTQEAQTGALPSDVGWILNETFFNRSRQHRVTGPLSVEEWQRQKALTTSLATDQYRLRGNVLLLMPVPPAGETYAFEYITTNFVISADGELRTGFQADSDLFRISERLLRFGMVWRWKLAKGLDYAEDFRSYEIEVATMIARESTAGTLSAAGPRSSPGPHACVPEGNWFV